jgi:FkbM family methyltransferase
MEIIKKLWGYRRSPLHIVEKTIAFVYQKLVRNTLQHLSRIITMEKRVLVYCGLNRGSGFERIFRKYHTCYGFEASPELAEYCRDKYKRFKNVTIIHGALNTYDGEVTFHISSNDSASSSLSNMLDPAYNNAHVKYFKDVTVPSINLNNFCQKNNIQSLTQYVSDIEGMDLEVLKTLKPLLDEKRIQAVQCEVGVKQLHPDLPPNSLEDFNSFLAPNYELIASGWGELKKGVFRELPDGYWHMDCLWSLKD